MRNTFLCFLIGSVVILFSCKKTDNIKLSPVSPIDKPDLSNGRGAGGSSDGLSIFNCDTCFVTDPEELSSNFNGTPINEGRYIWFTSNIKINNSSSLTQPFALALKSSSINFSVNGMTYNQVVPAAQINFSDTATSSSTFWNGTFWNTTIPLSQKSNSEIFLTGFAIQVPPGGFPGGLNPINWNSLFITNAPANISIQYKWAAAVYSNFPIDYSDAAVVPLKSSTHAGTPSNFKNYVIGGARGGGGSNYTGSWSGTAHPIFH